MPEVNTVLWKLLVVVALVTTSVAVAVVNAVTGTDIHTIAQVSSTPNQGGTVCIEGTITCANENRFELEDRTGSAALVTCPIWYKHISLYPGDVVTVIGQVMRSHPSSSNSEISISVYRILRNDEMIIVRDKPGRPPWASTALR